MTEGTLHEYTLGKECRCKDSARPALLLAHGSVPVEQLLGVRPEVLDELHDRGVPTRAYVPYGADWFRYWMRRLAESRGA